MVKSREVVYYRILNNSDLWTMRWSKKPNIKLEKGFIGSIKSTTTKNVIGFSKSIADRTTIEFNEMRNLNILYTDINDLLREYSKKSDLPMSYIRIILDEKIDVEI